MKNRVLYLICCMLCWLSLTWGTAAAQELRTLVTRMNKTQNVREKAALCLRIARVYQQEGAHNKAIEYLSLAEELDTTATVLNRARISDLIGQSMAANADHRGALLRYEVARHHYRQMGDTAEVLSLLIRMMATARYAGMSAEVLEYGRQTVAWAAQSGQSLAAAEALHNMAFVRRQNGQAVEAIALLEQSLGLLQKAQKQTQDPALLYRLYISTGVTYAYMADHRQAQRQYQLALQLAEATQDARRIANAYNCQAANYLVSGTLDKAYSYATQALDIATAEEYEQGIADACLILADFFRMTEDFKQSQEYTQRHQDISKKAAEKLRQQQQRAYERQLESERRESEWRTALAEKDRQEAALRQAELERDKQKSDLELLHQQQALQAADLRNQQLERQRVQQLLEITRQRAESEQLRQAKELADKNREIEAARFAQREAEKQRAIEAMQRERALQEQRLQEGQLRDDFNRNIQWLGGVILLLVLAGLAYTVFSLRKFAQKNREIEQQRQEIVTQNEELHQQAEEILAQRDAISAKNDALNRQHDQITKSIHAAQLIQTAMLPTRQRMQTMLGEHFVLFRPCEVVSGDFYWMNESDGRVFLAAVDCTGHGVPGAFLTMIGISLLDKIVRERHILSPAEILHQLDLEIQLSLSQHETGDDNGMDVCLVCLRPDKDDHTEVIFSGAKRPLCYLTPGQPEVQKLRGDRRYIGSLHAGSAASFTDQTLLLPRGSIIYLFSDGFADQNNLQRQKFGDYQFQQMLRQHGHLPLEAQGLAYAHILDEHASGTKQRDDIVLIGVRL